jgi:hypothetical protein
LPPSTPYTELSDDLKGLVIVDQVQTEMINTL